MVMNKLSLYLFIYIANLFLESLKRLLEKSAIVLTLRPLCIENTNTEKQFLKFTPPIK